MADADIKAEMKKAVLELQSLANELNSALDRTSAKIEANDLIGSGLKDLYERVNARAQVARVVVSGACRASCGKNGLNADFYLEVGSCSGNAKWTQSLGDHWARR